MSGGHFNYQNYRIDEIADKIESLINKEKEYEFSPKVIDKFRKAVKTLRKASVMVNRIDYLASGDDGDETFLHRWKVDMAKLKKDIADEE